MKSIIAVGIILILFLLAINSQVGATPSECPEGTYNIGISKTDEPLCKIIPTGCSVADSIPMDSCVEPDTTTQESVPSLPTSNPVADTYLPEFKGK